MKSVSLNFHHPVLQCLRCESKVFLPFRQVHHRQLLQLCRHTRRRMLGHLHHIYSTAARRVWRNVPPFAPLLADTGGIRMSATGVGECQGSAAEERHRAVTRQGYQRPNDV